MDDTRQEATGSMTALLDKTISMYSVVERVRVPSDRF